jgi:putative FmdB family regulatory protein
VPNYEYRCKRCGEHFDAMTAMDNRDELQTCPECKAFDSERVFNTGKPAIYFHGRGWSCVDKNYKDGS